MKRKKGLLILTLFIVVLLLLMGNVFAKGPDTNGQAVGFYKASALNPSRTLLNINNWSYWQYYDGRSGVDPDGNSGGIFPRGTAGVVYEDGIVFGAVVDGQIRVGGQTYRVGTRPVLDHIYRIRSDWRTLVGAEVLQDAAEFYRTTQGAVTDAQLQELIDQYAADWENWPVNEGAPWTDVDSNGVYDPDVDIAGIASADQVIYYVVDDQDPGRTTNLYGSEPIGVRIDVTLWGYKQPGARLGQIIFKKYKFYNISGKTLNDMYFAQWVDPDIGNYTDDVVGCDSVLSLGFAYNGPETDNDFAAFGLAPAAMGYDFFQGPIKWTNNPNDTAVFDLQTIKGAYNMGMTSFGYFSAGNQEWSDPRLGDYERGTLAWYNLLRGYIPNPNVTDPTPFTHRDTGVPTKFPLNGDPITGVGDIDGQGANFAPADRRMTLNTGPFTMAPDTVQEVVVALIGGRPGESRVDAVADLKITDQIAQSLYDALFTTVPKAPPSPKVSVTPFERKILLTWGEDPAAVKATEETVYKDSPTTQYEFEGYNVYQLPNASAIDKAKRIATFDKVNGVTMITGRRFLPEFGAEVVVPIQYGNDYGIQRYFVIDKDYITGGPLYPGNEYYFAVTAYNYNPNPQLIEDKALESSITPILVTTQSPKPGVQYTADPEQELKVTHTSGASDGLVKALVIDPSAVTGHQYEVFFEVDEDTNSATYGETLWGVRDVTTGEIKVSKQKQASDLAEATDTPIFDGLQVRVAGPPLAIREWHYASGDPSPLYPDYDGGRWFTGVNWGGTAVFGGVGIWENFWGSSAIAPEDLVPVKVEWAAMTGYDDLNNNGQYDIGEPYQFDTSQGQKAFMYQTWGGGNYLGFFDVPFKVFDVSDPDNPRQLNVVVRDRDGNHQWDLHTDDTPYNYIFIMATDYDPNGKIYDPNQGGLDIMAKLVSADDRIPAYYAMWLQQRGARPPLAEAGELDLIPNIINTPADVFQFTAPEVKESVELAREVVDKVSVYPNPYYAYNPQEPNRFTKFVTFYHLPQKATIRIFALDGTHVVTLNKDDDSQFLRWNLQNKNGLPVASGIYIAHVKMTLDDGSTVEKTLKLFIIQEQQILKYF